MWLHTGTATRKPHAITCPSPPMSHPRRGNPPPHNRCVPRGRPLRCLRPVHSSRFVLATRPPTNGVDGAYLHDCAVFVGECADRSVSHGVTRAAPRSLFCSCSPARGGEDSVGSGCEPEKTHRNHDQCAEGQELEHHDTSASAASRVSTLRASSTWSGEWPTA
jgi:hypothetical protein